MVRESTMGMEMEEGRGEDESVQANYFDVLPEGCVANIVSLTTPRDACRLSLVSTIFRSAADSDAVWDRFLPPDCLSAVSSSSLPTYPSKKDLYISLCERPVLIDQGTKSFSLDKLSGKKCYMLSARSLHIVWSDTPRYWRWIPLPEARFEAVAELIRVCWLEIWGKINIAMLSPSTLYSANFVFKPNFDLYGFQHQPVEATIGLAGGEKSSRTVFLDSERGRRARNPIIPRRFGPYLRGRNMELAAQNPRESEGGCNQPRQRKDGWFEIEVGEFFYDGILAGELEMGVLEVRGGNWKSGLVVHGIELRPKKTFEQILNCMWRRNRKSSFVVPGIANRPKKSLNKLYS